LGFGDSTGLKYNQITKKLGIWFNSKELLQVGENGIKVEGTLRIGSSAKPELRKINKIVIGDGGYVQIGEWEKDNVLSIKADSISLDVKHIAPKTGGKMGLKSCIKKQYISTTKDKNKDFLWSDDLDQSSNFTLEMSCSRDIKENIVSLTAEEANNTIAQLNAVKYDYKGEPAFRPNLGFIAEEMPDSLASADRKSLSPFEVIPVLTRVVQEQQQKIDSLQLEVSELQKKLAHSEELG
jgi:hypothetical protein